MRVLGIDPGITGAVALLEGGVAFASVVDMPVMQRGVSSKKQMVNAAELARLIRELAPTIACVELVQAMPPRGDESGMGAASAFNFGETAGVIRGVLGALGIETHYVTPVSWKSRAGLRGSDKEASRSLAVRLWPMAPLARKKDSGRAEALLIARYGLKLFSETTSPPVPRKEYNAAEDPFDPDQPKRAAPMPQALL